MLSYKVEKKVKLVHTHSLKVPETLIKIGKYVVLPSIHNGNGLRKGTVGAGQNGFPEYAHSILVVNHSALYAKWILEKEIGFIMISLTYLVFAYNYSFLTNLIDTNGHWIGENFKEFWPYSPQIIRHNQGCC